MIAPADEPLDVAVSPSGKIELTRGSVAGDGLAPGMRASVAAAFASGTGPGLIELGAAAVELGLPAPLGFVRDVGKAFVTRLCASADLETLRERLVIEAPAGELAALAAAVPPMPGAEYVDAARLAAWWDEMAGAFREAIAAHDGPVAAWLAARSPLWNVVGRVCFHLAENRDDDEHPFAFLATYTQRVSAKRRVVHVPLERALADSSSKGDRAGLLSLLEPVRRAAERSALVAELLETGELYEPMAWTPAQAHRFLREIPLLEAAGVTVRVPDWWRARRPPRPEVRVHVGAAAPAEGVLAADALLDFDVSVTLDGEPLSAAELRALLDRGDEGLVTLRGRWVELDRGRLEEVLDHWKSVEKRARNGLSFLEGMRLLAGARVDLPPAAGAEIAPPPERVVPGEWLAATLAALRAPEGLAAAEPGDALKTTLRPYQALGVRWLWFATQLGLGVCLADDMGLGKTVQVIAFLLLARRRRVRDDAPHLLVVPASLVGNWQAELARFAPDLRLHVAHPSAANGGRRGAALEAPAPGAVDVVLTTYGLTARLPWLAEPTWTTVILDEAQAVKNPSARQSRAVKTLRGRARIALTGTPVENRLGDLWSLFDFLDPGLLGSAREFAQLTKLLVQRPEGYAPLRRLIAPYLLRRLKSQVAGDLPSKTEVKAFCGLAPRQAALYQRAVDELRAELAAVKEGMQRRGRILAYLMRFKQICNHPAQSLGEGLWTEGDSGKLARLRELVETIAERRERALIFTQFREATAPLAAFLAELFGRPGLVLHGGTPVARRAELVREFQRDDGPPFFVLSVKAGGTGLNLTAASHVVHFDRWWNPAVEDQATDRAHRIGQRRNVLVHKLVCRGTVEERIDEMITAKTGLARTLVGEDGEAALTEMRDDELLAMVALDLKRAVLE